MQEAEQPAANGLMSTVLRGLLMYFAFTMFLKKPESPSSPDMTAVDEVLPDSVASISIGADGPKTYSNLFKLGQEMNLHVFLSTTEDGYSIEDLIWREDSIFYDWQEKNSRSTNVSIPLTGKWSPVQSNGTLFAHVYMALPKVQPDPSSSFQQRYKFVYGVQQLNRYVTQPKIDTRTSLLRYSKDDAATHSDEHTTISELDNGMAAEVALASVTTPAARPTISMWKPKLSLNLIIDHTVYPGNAVPIQMKESMKFDKEKRRYYPKLYFNDFWSLREHQFPVNDTLESVELEIEYYPLSLMKWQLMEQMVQSWKQQKEMGTGGSEHETEILKNMLLETSPALLATTFVVSIFHMVFDMLAFKNDIKFWRNRKSLEGLSVSGVFLSSFCQAVIFLYLCNSEEVSNIVLLSSGLGMCIEFWKIQKVVVVEINYENKIFGVIPRISYRHQRSYQTITQKYDRIAMRYMSYTLYPLVVGYSVFSLVHEKHNNWYSWVLGSLVGAVYTFGFIMMTPQLYINYKLKSVAHMPWRVMIYKSLNTFVDDLFAFIIKMPLLHRLACFRDDIIFFIFLYQRYIYKVDKNRVNEYGQVGPQDDALKTADGQAAGGHVADTPQTLSPAAESEWAQMDAH